MPSSTQATSSADDATPRFHQHCRVTKVCPNPLRVKCELPGRRSGGGVNPVESSWLRVLVPLASQSGFRCYHPPKKGDRGAVLCNQNGNKGIWLGGYYNDERPAPYDDLNIDGWKHDDGAESYYNAELHAFFETTPGRRVTHADISQKHTAGKTYEIQAEIVSLSTPQGASLTLMKGAVVLQNALGHKWLLGGYAGDELVGSCRFDMGGAEIEWDNVGGFKVNREDVTTVTHTHPTTGRANSPGSYVEF